MRHNTPYGAGAYAAIGIETGVAAADPLGLVIMLYDGAIQAILHAEGRLAARDVEGRGRFTSKAIDIVKQGLSASLDTRAGGELAQSLDSLYDYMIRRLFEANRDSSVAAFGEVKTLLSELRGAWLLLRESSGGNANSLGRAARSDAAPARALVALATRSAA